MVVEKLGRWLLATACNNLGVGALLAGTIVPMVNGQSGFLAWYVNGESEMKRPARFAIASIVGTSLLAAAPASAANIPCLDRALGWMNAPSANERHTVEITMVALHTNGISAYGHGGVEKSTCPSTTSTTVGGPRGTEDCMMSNGPVTMLMSDRLNGVQPFDVTQSVKLAIGQIPMNGIAEVTMSRIGAEYRFRPQCVGELVTGNDQFGNHWTMSFQLKSGPKVN